MRRSLRQQIAANSRASFFHSGVLVLLLAVFGGSLVGIFAPERFWVGAAASAGVGLLVGLAAWRFGPEIVLQTTGARDATPLEHQVLDNVVEEMAIAAGMPKPRVCLIDDAAMNAFATGRDPRSATVAITTGLMRRLDRDELQGVIAHEMAHIRNYDVRQMTTLAVVAGLIPLLADIFWNMRWFGFRSRDRDSGGNALALAFFVIALALAVLAPIFAKFLEMAVSRQREYLADATAAELTRYPDGLARALEKISHDDDPLDRANRATAHLYIVNPLHPFQEEDTWLSTHPPIQARVAALRSLMGSQEPRAVAP